MGVLECSTKGDPDYSALKAKVTFWGKTKIIENWYQCAKVFATGRPEHWRECKGKDAKYKGKEIIAVFIEGHVLAPEYLTQWYNMLWFNYLEANPRLVEYASKFDDFNDIFAHGSVNSQANCIRTYVKEGPQALYKTFEELEWILTAEPGTPYIDYKEV